MQRTISHPIADMWPDSTSPISLTTSTTYLLIDTDAQRVTLYADNDFQIKLSPRIKCAWFYSASAGTYGDGATANVNAADELQDKDTTTALTLNSMTANDYVYIGLDVPCVGFYTDVGNTNTNASAMTVNYYNGSAWTDVTATDGTSASSKTFAQDGAITWTEPSDEVKTTVNGVEMYWYQIAVDATLDSSVTVLQMQALSRRGVSYLEALVLKTIELNKEATAGLELNVASSTGTLELTWENR